MQNTYECGHGFVHEANTDPLRKQALNLTRVRDRFGFANLHCWQCEDLDRIVSFSAHSFDQSHEAFIKVERDVIGYLHHPTIGR